MYAGYRDRSINIYMACGIYKITIEDQFYIGSSKDIECRWRQHNVHLKRGHSNYKIKKAFKDCGNISYSIIEECLEEELIEKEQYYFDSLKPLLNISPIAGRAPGYERCFNIRDPFGNIHSFNSIKECSDQYNLCTGAVSELLDYKRDQVQGWVRENDDYRKVKRRRGLIDPDNREVIISNVENFCTDLQLSSGEISKVLNGKKLHYRGWRLPENKNINHNFYTKKIIKNGVILSYNHPDDLKQKPELKKYKLRPDSLRSLFKGLITNHKGWMIYRPHLE